MKITFNSWRHRVSLLLLFTCIAATLLAPLSSNLVFPLISDTFNHLAYIAQAKIALHEGQFPLRVLPLEQDGWRYPGFLFYSSSAYTIAGLIYTWLTPSNPFVAYKITIWLAFVAGGIYMYRLAYWLVKNRIAAILASIAYLLSPYHFIIINHLSAFTEALAFGILPIVIYYTLQHFYYPKLKSFLQASLFWYLLATIHFITFFYSALFIALWLFLIAIKKSTWKNFFKAGGTFIFGCLLAVWSLAPMASLGKYFIVNRTFQTPDYFYSFSPKISTLLSAGANIAGKVVDPDSSILFENTVLAVHPSIGIAIIIAAILAIYAIINNAFSKNRRADFLLAPTVLVFIIAFVLAWSPINFWRWLPHQLMAVQYSWRLLGQVMWLGALLFAWALCWLFRNKLDAKHLVLGILLLILSTSAWTPMGEVTFTKVDSFLKKPMLVFNTPAYLIDARLFNKFTTLVDDEIIDELMLPMVPVDNRFGDHLNLNQAINISPRFLKSAFSPSIFLQGEIPANYEHNLQLAAVINGKVAAIQNLTPGVFNWNIPLNKYAKTNNKVSVLFKLNGPNVTEKTLVPINAVVLRGKFNPAQIVSVKQTQTHCTQQGETTLCKWRVPAAAKLIELPAIYYPDLLRIKLNGKPVGYISVFHQGRLIAAIAPEAGKMNSIEIQFAGLMWANYLSSAMWQLWLILLVYASLRHVLYRSKIAK